VFPQETLILLLGTMKKFYFLLPLIFLLTACGDNGADDISELSSKVFNALQSQNQSALARCEPSVPDMEKAIEMNFEDSTRTEAARHDAAMNKTATLQLNLDQAFSNVVAGAKKRNIDWKTAQLKDFRYTINEHVEDYKDADVHLVVSCGKIKSQINFKAYLFDSRWYLVEGLEWDN